MARKLNHEEKARLLKRPGRPDFGREKPAEEGTSLRQLTQKRDVDLRLSPELAFWFGRDVSGRLLP
jgi:hypothetical protein